MTDSRWTVVTDVGVVLAPGLAGPHTLGKAAAKLVAGAPHHLGVVTNLPPTLLSTLTRHKVVVSESHLCEVVTTTAVVKQILL